MLVRSPRWLAQRGCCSSPQPQVTRAFQTAGSSHRLHLTVLGAMGQCAGVVVRGSSTGARDCPPAAVTLRPVASAGSGGPTVEEREGSKNRRQDWRSTLFNVTAAMLAALFTAGAGVAGVAVAG